MHSTRTHVVTRFTCLYALRMNTWYVTPIIAFPLQIFNVKAYKSITERAKLRRQKQCGCCQQTSALPP